MLRQGVWFLWSKKNTIIFQKQKGNSFTLLIIFIVKSLQKEQNSTWPQSVGINLLSSQSDSTSRFSEGLENIRFTTLFFLFILCLIICRDNGITIQIMSYQVYTELILFLVLFIFGFIPFEKNMVIMEIMKVLSNFAIFVVQPLFYLNGDVNFRNRVQNQGLWKALKKELFQTNSLFQPV